MTASLSALYIYVNTRFYLEIHIINKYVFSFLIRKRHFVLRKENIHIDYLIYFSNSNIFENKFKYIDPLFYF